ncbi:hypothetical protein M8818_002687 [Zalaria obscura]|uniref:Uncharacterized protein n=1 Tax=Zalaria obscura TaxID=2024903 RepID=A0ACC3SH05_9PEZI
MQGFSISDATEGKPAIAMEDPWRPSSAQQAPYEPVQSVSSHPTGSGNPWQTDLDRETGKNETTTVPPVAPQVQSFKPQPSLLDEDPVPQLPPRPSGEYAPPQPPRPAPIDVSQVDRRASEPETPMTKARRQRNEHYQIKHVNWADMSRGSHEMRRSPILTQNANGPCPLLALVNALVLSTPQGMNTALFETLKSREQVSLGLLLDAVFEELVRRNESTGKDLPDIGDLYSFLITLHTGMNVNPRLVASSSQPSGSLNTDAVGSGAKPGAFEETREMRLYSTFDVPLIHGWIPPVGSAAYAASERSAQTFEDAQNIQFHEEELEDKLRAQGLSAPEQQTLEDIASIKSFLNSYPTQLTDYGLDVMKRSLKPGQIAILFRNDHFATLYKESRSGTLMTLVTDAGYSTHDEIVWESLVDVNGAASELFSGDFRPVGNTNSGGLSGQTSGSTGNVTDQPDYSQFEGGWQTVQPRNNRGNRNARNNNSGGSTSFHTPADAVNIPVESAEGQFSPPPELGRTTSEQEDHDLALALQLQEEEEERERRETAARRTVINNA